MNGAFRWANRLGLATTRLFPSGHPNLEGEHYAMLDGRAASFACSTIDTDISQEDSRNWRWSADLAHHVLITPNEVQVRSGRDPSTRSFQRGSVENRLEEFLTFLDSSRRYALPDVVSFLIKEFRDVWAASGYSQGQPALACFLLALQAAGQNDPSILHDAAWRQDAALSIGIDDPALAAGASMWPFKERGDSKRMLRWVLDWSLP
jgi:hypothetical protein